VTRSSNSGRAAFVYALADQGAVSAGNFLVIALGAHFLPIAEQGKLVYAFGIYYGLVVFNIAAFFTVPLLLRGERAQWDCYRRLLLRGQLIAAAVTALGIGILLARWGGQLQWPMSRSEFLLLGGFYFLQQLADFYRRSGYVFDAVLPATVTSQLIFWSRIGAVVTRDVEAFSIVAGNPAREIRKRFAPDVARRIEALAWWNWDAGRLARNAHLFALKCSEQAAQFEHPLP
jgi:hypothetical protein